MPPSFFGHERCRIRCYKPQEEAALRQPKKGKDDYDKLSLSTGRSFFEDILKVGARRLITDAELGRSGSKCFSCDEMKCQSGLGWRQAKVTPQQTNGLVHDKARDGSRQHLVRVPLLSRCAPFRGLVYLRQRFVRRCQDEKDPRIGAQPQSAGGTNSSSTVSQPRRGIARQ